MQTNTIPAPPTTAHAFQSNAVSLLHANSPACSEDWLIELPSRESGILGKPIVEGVSDKPSAGSAAGEEMDITTIKKIQPSHFPQQEKIFIGLTMPHPVLHTDATA